MKAVSFLCLLLFSVVRSCPNGYTQTPNDGACYKINEYYDVWATQFIPKSYDQAEIDCQNAGAFLASVHSNEENDFVSELIDTDSRCAVKDRNIGLVCEGKTCHWRDGSVVTYTNFNAGDEPLDDGRKRCYGANAFDHKWRHKDCGSQAADCWVCKRPIDCHYYETAYNGGCVSVYTWPQDLKSAEDACPIGGDLISIHSNDDNNHYMQLALAAGINGTINIGGQFDNGLFKWMDGTDYDNNHWAKGFPNQVLGNCAQMLLDPQLGVQGLWANVDCAVKQPYICFRSGFSLRESDTPAPKAVSRCPSIQNFTGSGSVYSPNYPISIPSQQTCEYILEAKEGCMALLIFHHFNCQQGTSLTLYDGLTDPKPFITFTSNSPPPTQTYAATSNIFKLIFTTNENDDPVGTGWEAEFTGISL